MKTFLALTLLLIVSACSAERPDSSCPEGACLDAADSGGRLRSDGGTGDGGAPDAALPDATTPSDAGGTAADAGPGFDAGPPCNSTCEDAGEMQCEDGRFRSCVEDSRGCRRWRTWLPCASNRCESPSSCDSCVHACDLGSQQCSDGAVQECTLDADGCRAWGAPVACADGFCASSSACGTCSHRCPAAGATECSGSRLRTCEADSRGCRRWSPSRRCDEGFCADGSSCGTCSHGCPRVGATSCMGGALRRCVSDANGCRSWSASSACAEGFCADGVTCGTCSHTCPVAGATSCSAGSLRQCVADGDGCRSWAAPSMCAEGFCADSSTCGTCPNECPAEGLSCGAGTLRRCVADARGCRRRVESSCGEGCSGAACRACAGVQSAVRASHAVPGTSGRRLVRSGSLLLVPDDSRGLHVLDAANPLALRDLSTYPVDARDIAMRGAAAVVVGLDHLTVVDLSAPATPTAVGTVALPTVRPRAVEVVGRYAYVLGDELAIVDLQNSASPSLVATHGTPGFGDDLVVVGSQAFLEDSRNGIRVVDVSQPSMPTLVSAIAPAQGRPADRLHSPVAFGDAIVAVAEDSGGIGIPTRYELRAFDPDTTGFPLVHFAETGGSTAPAVTGGRLFQAEFGMLRSFGAGLADPSRFSIDGNGGNPVPAGDGRHHFVASSDAILTADLTRGSRDRGMVAVQSPTSLVTDRGVLLVGGRDGVTAVDISDPDVPTMLGRYSSGAAGQVFDLAPYGDSVVVSMFRATHVVSFDDPGSPVLDAVVPKAGDAVAVAGDRLYLLDAGEITIWDLTATPPVQRGTFATRANSVAVAGDLIVVGRPYDTEVWQLTAAGTPVLAGALSGGGVVLGAAVDRAFVAGDGLTAGDDFLRVLDLSVPTSPTVIAKDTGFDPDAFVADGSFGYALRTSELRIYDLTAAGDITAVTTHRLPSSYFREAITVQGGYAYATGDDVIHVVATCR